MSVTNYLTNSGRLLLAKILATERLVYTRATASSDVVEHPEQLQALPNERQTAHQLMVEQQGDYASISCSFNCRELSESYQLSMVGVYATIENSPDEVLYMVTVYDPDDGAVTLPAGQDISYRFVIYDTIATGELGIVVSDAASAPYDHVLNAYRHVFMQTNDNASVAVVNSGGFKEFVAGQRILFIPSVTLTSGQSVLSMAGQQFALAVKDLAGNVLSGQLFLPHKSYVLRFENGAFTYVKHDTVEVVQGVAHYWNGAAWETVIPAGQIIASASASAPSGTLLCNGQEVDRTAYPELFAVLGTACGTPSSNTTFKLPDARGRSLIGVSSSHSRLSSGGSETVTITVDQMPRHNHTGTISISGGSHNHSGTVSIGSHTHSISGTTGYSGAHEHAAGLADDYDGDCVYGSTTRGLPGRAYSTRKNDQTDSLRSQPLTSSDGIHTHSFSGTTSAAGAVNRSFTTEATKPSLTGSATINYCGSGQAHNNMQPYLAVNYYIYTGRVLL